MQDGEYNDRFHLGAETGPGQQGSENSSLQAGRDS